MCYLLPVFSFPLKTTTLANTFSHTLYNKSRPQSYTCTQSTHLPSYYNNESHARAYASFPAALVPSVDFVQVVLSRTVDRNVNIPQKSVFGQLHASVVCLTSSVVERLALKSLSFSEYLFQITLEGRFLFLQKKS